MSTLPDILKTFHLSREGPTRFCEGNIHKTPEHGYNYDRVSYMCF